MGSSLRIVSLNLQGAFQKRPWTGDLPRLIASHRPDVALLQECKPNWFEQISAAAGMQGMLSYDVPPEMSFSFKDGCAIAVRPPIQIEGTWRLPAEAFQPKVVQTRIAEEPIPNYEELPENLACRYSGRALFARLSFEGKRFVAASFHATPGTGRTNGGKVHEFKPFFHGAVALALADLGGPYVFGIDANEPFSETPSAVTFHWEEGQSGFEKLAALLGLEPIHPARDLLRESLNATETSSEADTYLVKTHVLEGGSRRYDSIWATPEFRLENMNTYYADAWDAGTDHALIEADLSLAGL